MNVQKALFQYLKVSVHGIETQPPTLNKRLTGRAGILGQLYGTANKSLYYLTWLKRGVLWADNSRHFADRNVRKIEQRSKEKENERQTSKQSCHIHTQIDKYKLVHPFTITFFILFSRKYPPKSIKPIATSTQINQTWPIIPLLSDRIEKRDPLTLSVPVIMIFGPS